MFRRIRFHPDFKKDLNGQLRWLAENRDDHWIKQLQNGIDEAIRLLSEFPAVGTIERQEGDVVLRRLILRRLPYVIWFVSNDKKAAPRYGSCAFFTRAKIAPFQLCPCERTQQIDPDFRTS